MTPHSFYLAGPMTGIPKFNFPAFDSAAAELRDQGYEITSPAELDDPSTREAALASPDGAPGSGAANDETYGTFLARDVKLVIDDVDGVVVIDDWFKSRGARIEVFTAATMGKPIYYYDAGDRRITEFALAQLEGILKPGDPGINGHKTPAEAAGPPFSFGDPAGPPSPEAEDWLKALDPDKINDALRQVRENGAGEPIAVCVRSRPEGVTTLWGLEVRTHASLEPGEFRLEFPIERKRTSSPRLLEEVAPDTHAPSGEVRTTSATGGQKGKKPERLSIIPPEALWELARVYAVGAEKYDDHNYLRGYDWSLSIDAGLRHFTQWVNGEDNDPECGTSHLMHAAWHCFTLYMFQQHQLGTDDRIAGILPEMERINRTGRSEAAREETS